MHSNKFHLAFHPDSWTPPGKFLKFLGQPFPKTRALEEAIQTCVDHTRKFETFAEIAREIAPKVALDKAALKSNGFSPANHSRQFAAIVEVLVCELYSILDGLRYTTYYIYGKTVRGVQSKSTSKFFSKAAENSYGIGFPVEISALLTQSYNDWFFELRRLRTAFTHGGLGSCWLSEDSQKITYMNPSLGTSQIAHVIEDIVAHVNKLAAEVFSLSQAFFEYHYKALEQIESDQFCGFHKGRGYARKVKPEIDLSWGSGICISKGWFESEPEFRCPLAAECGAYSRSS